MRLSRIHFLFYLISESLVSEKREPKAMVSAVASDLTELVFPNGPRVMVEGARAGGFT